MSQKLLIYKIFEAKEHPFLNTFGPAVRSNVALYCKACASGNITSTIGAISKISSVFTKLLLKNNN